MLDISFTVMCFIRPNLQSRAVLGPVSVFLMIALAFSASGQEKQDDKKPSQRVISVAPFSAWRGKSQKVIIRGASLAETTGARLEGNSDPVVAAVKSKGKSDPGKGDPAKMGDSQVELEFTVAADDDSDSLSLILTTPSGDTKPFTIRLLDAANVVDEKEPNGGFREAQEIKPDQIIRGSIQDVGDVDVFKIRAKAGQMFTAELDAARHGSPLDSLLILYDGKGHELARNDDSDVGTDSILKFKVVADAEYYLCLSDANGGGGVGHAYLLCVRVNK